MKKLIAAAGFIIVLVTCASAQSSVPDDETAIRKTALDYIEGWYEGDAARLEKRPTSGTGEANYLD